MPGAAAHGWSYCVALDHPPTPTPPSHPPPACPRSLAGSRCWRPAPTRPPGGASFRARPGSCPRHGEGREGGRRPARRPGAHRPWPGATQTAQCPRPGATQPAHSPRPGATQPAHRPRPGAGGPPNPPAPTQLSKSRQQINYGNSPLGLAAMAAPLPTLPGPWPAPFDADRYKALTEEVLDVSAKLTDKQKMVAEASASRLEVGGVEREVRVVAAQHRTPTASPFNPRPTSQPLSTLTPSSRRSARWAPRSWRAAGTARSPPWPHTCTPTAYTKPSRRRGSKRER